MQLLLSIDHLLQLSADCNELILVFVVVVIYDLAGFFHDDFRHTTQHTL